MDVRATFGEWPNYLTLWPTVLRITFVHYFIAFCSRPEATSDVLSGKFVGPVIADKIMKFGGNRINLS